MNKTALLDLSDKGEDATPGENLTPGEIARKVTSWFDTAVDAAGKVEVVAAYLDMSPAQVSDIRAGRKTISLNRLMQWLLQDPPAFLSFVNAMAIDGGCLPTSLRPNVDARELRRQVFGAALESTNVRRIVERFGLNTGEAAKLLAEDTRS